MRPDTKRHIHLSVNLVLSPGLPATPGQVIELQQRLADPTSGVLFDSVRREGSQVWLQRNDPPLELRCGPGSPQEFQLLIMSRHPNYRLGDFADEVEIVAAAAREVWPGLQQAWRREVTIAHLYAVAEGSSFEYLWVQRLGQPTRDLERLGRSVRGGGLRLVLPPNPGSGDSPYAEIRIESFFADLSQLFVEGAFDWRDPVRLSGLELRSMLLSVEEYLDAEVRAFVGLVAA